METDKNNENTQEGTNSQNVSKEYPGYTPDPQSGTTNDEFIDADTKDTDADARLAAKGPVRNSNYHELTDNVHTGNYAAKGSSNKQKTLEDYNKTDPKRDINTTEVIDESRPSGMEK